MSGPKSGELKELISQIRERIVSTEDTVCLERARLASEAYGMYGENPPPLRRARTFSHILQNMTLDTETNPVFAGNTSTKPRAWMLVPEHGFAEPPQIVLENPGLKGIMARGVPEELREYWADKSFGGNSGIGHLAVDYGLVVHRGLEALADEAERGADEGSSDARIYRRSMGIALRARVQHTADYYWRIGSPRR